MKRLFLLLIVALVAACQAEPDVVEPNKPNNPEDVTPEEPALSFEAEVTAVTRTTMTFTVTPSIAEADYFCYVVERAEADEYTKDKYLIATIYQEVTDVASDGGKTFEEYMATATDRGTIEEGSFSGLAPKTEYYLLLFGVDAERSFEPTTELVKVPFTTAQHEVSDCTFEVETTVVDNSVTFDVRPSDKATAWYFCTVTRAQFDYYTTAEDGPKWSKEFFYEYYFQQDINAMREAGYTDQQIINALIHYGDLTLEAKGLNANTEHLYLVAALMLDAEGIAITSAVSSGSYTTGDAAASTMTFDIEVWDVEQMAASVRITPSNNTDTYCALIQPWDGVSTADEVMHQLVEQWGGWMDIMANDRGAVEHSGANKFKLPAADTEYYVIAFGYAGGITTEAAMVTFRTLPGGSIDDVQFEITTSSVGPYGFNMHITSTDPTIYYVPGACLKEEYVESEFVAMESEAFDYFYAGASAFNPSITIAEVLDQYYYNGNAEVQVSGVLPDSSYMGYIYILDVHTGDVVKCLIFDDIAHTSALGSVNPTVELVGYFSGDEAYASELFTDKSGKVIDTRGVAITVVHYADIENARTLFTTMVGDDLTNTFGYPDNVLWDMTLGLWNTCSVSQPYAFYTAEWNVEQTAMAYATDNEGRMGAIGRLYTMPTAEQKSPIAELEELVTRLNSQQSACEFAVELR